MHGHSGEQRRDHQQGEDAAEAQAQAEQGATGVSWALGLGRIGSIVGSLSGGALLGLGLGFSGILALLVIPALLAAVAVHRLGRRRARPSSVTL